MSGSPAASRCRLPAGLPLPRLVHPRAPDPGHDEGAWAEARDAATRGPQLYNGSTTWPSPPPPTSRPRCASARRTGWREWKGLHPAEE